MRFKIKLFAMMLAVAMIASAIPAMAQAGYAKIKGKALSEQGQILAGASIDLVGKENGAKYHYKTDKKGEYYSIGIQPGVYKATLSDSTGKVLWTSDNVQIRLAVEDSLNVVDFDLAKEKKNAVNDPSKLTPEQRKQMEQYKKQNEQAAKENETIKGLNQMLAEHRAAMAAGNPEQAIVIMTQATRIDPTKDLLWSALGDAHLAAAKKAAGAERTPHYTEAVGAYKKAIDIAAAVQPAADPKKLAQYNNNYAEGLSKSGQIEPAVAAWEKAAQLDPTTAAMYYFNEGATFTNINKPDEAAKAFEKCVQADPKRADAYYLKGTALLSKAKLNADGTMTPVAGTADAFNKYLELAPDGPNAEASKQILASIGAKVETSYKKGKPAPKK